MEMHHERMQRLQAFKFELMPNGVPGAKHAPLNCAFKQWPEVLNNDSRRSGQLYRDCADAENAFDELKNQSAWGASRRMICIFVLLGRRFVIPLWIARQKLITIPSAGFTQHMQVLLIVAATLAHGQMHLEFEALG